MPVDADDSLLWLPESQFLELCGIPRATWHSWGRVGLAEPDQHAAYREQDVVKAATIARIRSFLGLKETASAWRWLKMSGQMRSLVSAAVSVAEGERLDLVVETATCVTTVVADDGSLARAARSTEAPRAVIVIPVAAEVIRVRQGFTARANRGAAPEERRRGRPRQAPAEVRPLRSGKNSA